MQSPKSAATNLRLLMSGQVVNQPNTEANGPTDFTAEGAVELSSTNKRFTKSGSNQVAVAASAFAVLSDPIAGFTLPTLQHWFVRYSHRVPVLGIMLTRNFQTGTTSISPSGERGQLGEKLLESNLCDVKHCPQILPVF